MIVRIPLPRNFHFDGVVRSHGWYDLPPFVYDRDAGTLRTSVSDGIRTGSAAFRVRDESLEAGSDTLDRATLTRIARRIFSLDVDLDGLARSLVDQPRLARALARGGGRMLRGADLFEDAVKILFTTNCSWAATKGMVTRLVALASPNGAFPRPEAVAKFRVSTLRARVRCGYRAQALSAFARRIACAQLDLASWERRDCPAPEIRAAILAEHGFGPYAAEGLLRILGRHDFLALDSWVRQKYRRLYPGPARSTDRSIARRYSRYGEYQGLALWLDMTSDWHEGAGQGVGGSKF